jgi:hypothetical protein
MRMSDTLSLADVARLSGVQRPVVSMWRKRPKAGLGFPEPTADGRFLAEEITAYLEATGRGNNPEVGRDVALAGVRSAHGEAPLEDLLTLVATVAVTGRSLAESDPEDLLDLVEALDPDDEWLFGELQAADIDGLAVQADAVIEAAWSPVEAYEALCATSRLRSPGRVSPGQELSELLASLVQVVRADRGALVDVAASGTDVIVRAASGDEVPDDLPVVVAAARPREARRRCAVHGIRPRVVAMGDDWSLPGGSVVLAALPDDADAAFDLLDEVAVQLGPDCAAVVAGPASVLVDAVSPALEARRDAFLREPGRSLAAVVRLPQGLASGGGREHMALWLLRPDAPERTWVADLAGHRLGDRVWREGLLDDLVAVASGVRERSFAMLHPVPSAKLLAAGGSLIDHDVAVNAQIPPSAGDDAARMRQLLDALAAPAADPFAGLVLAAPGSMPARFVTLGDASRGRRVRVASGARIGTAPPGTTPLWTSDAVASAVPLRTDLLTLAGTYPQAELTEPDDVVFTTAGQPRAVVDAGGGAFVAYPARVLRIAPGQPLSPRAIAAAINALPAGNTAWRSWPLPVIDADPAAADGILARVDAWAATLRERQSQVEELRRLVMRSVLPGAVTLTENRSDDVKGE